MPSDLEAKIGVHVNTKDPSKKEEVFGHVHLITTDLNQALALALPIGNSTAPANANEGTAFIAHRSTLALPVLPGQVQLGDAANDITANYEWLHARGTHLRRDTLIPQCFSLLKPRPPVTGMPCIVE
jgi:hypothetical protein